MYVKSRSLPLSPVNLEFYNYNYLPGSRDIFGVLQTEFYRETVLRLVTEPSAGMVGPGPLGRILNKISKIIYHLVDLNTLIAQIMP